MVLGIDLIGEHHRGQRALLNLPIPSPVRQGAKRTFQGQHFRFRTQEETEQMGFF